MDSGWAISPAGRRNLSGLPSERADQDEDAKRFDLLLVRIQLARFQSDALTHECLRKQVQDTGAGCERAWVAASSGALLV